MAKFGREHGYEFTPEELHARKAELEEKELDRVVGGATIVTKEGESGDKEHDRWTDVLR